MRDPARIDAVLAALREAWLESPELRLGQLIVNAVRPSAPCPEVFYVEDEVMLSGLNGYRELVKASGAAGMPGEARSLGVDACDRSPTTGP